ncbi:MAG: hypothetical protein ACK4F9_00005, partial [Brevinematia bacterium]
MKVLIVTNIFLLGNRIGTYLKSKGLDVTVYNPSSKLYQNLSPLINETDIIVLDLPRDRLEDIIKKIKEFDSTKPIIVLRNDTMHKDIVNILKLGIYKCVERPIDP